MVNDRRVYTVATAHLDTVWNWDFEHTVSECIFNTLAENFKLFEAYPDYKFSFEGAYRYELMEEYYPELFEQLKVYVEKGKWNVAGSSYENGDVNVPSPELLFRNILYGNGYFEKTFGKRSKDIYLPDSFGFGWALPSVANHANLLGFTTQKLSWGSANGIPFDLGRWYGSNGKWIFANLDGLSYCNSYKLVRKNPKMIKKIRRNEKEGGLGWTLALHGTGDVGGAPKEESVKTVCTELQSNESERVKVYSAKSDKIFEDLAELSNDEIYKLPEFRDELLMSTHGAGAYTSRAFGKRMNRRNEELADMAERSAVMASYLTDTAYPQAEIEKAWKRTIAHTFHDDITGTSLQKVYQRSWNDLIMSANQFTNVYEGAGQQVIKNIDTSWAKGTAVVVANSLEQTRSEAVEVELIGEDIEFIRVFDSKGDEYPCQLTDRTKTGAKAVFVATVPALGYKAFDIRISEERSPVNNTLRVSECSLENEKYFIMIDENGNISSIIDKTLANKELLKKPIGYHVMLAQGGKEYAAWEILYKDVKGIPWEFAGNGITEVIERGPARVTVKVSQNTDHADYTYYVSLTAGGKYVQVQNEIDWRTTKALLKNRFAFTASSKTASFDLGLGVIGRGNRNKQLYEVPAQKWADLSDSKNYYGVSVFSDSKYGWDKPDNNTLRLTAIFTPKNNYRDDSMQSMMDLGINRYGYGIYSHHGGYENGTQFYARCFNQPMGVFVTDKHVGVLGSEYSFGTISDENVIIRAIKKAEDTDEIIIRVNEGANRITRNVKISLGNGIESAREVYASEEELGEAVVDDGRLVFDLAPYEVKTFAVKLVGGRVSEKASQMAVSLPFNVDVVTSNDAREATIIPTKGVSIPAEIFPAEITCGGVDFKLGQTTNAMNNALICDGQEIDVDCDTLSIVAASLVGDGDFIFKVDDEEVVVPVQALEERIGCWDLYDLKETAFIKRDKLAWECTHTHSPEGDNVANQLFFFRYDLYVKGAKKVKLPEGNELIVMAATQINDTASTVIVSEMYDSIERRPFSFKLGEFQIEAYEKQLKKVMAKDKYKARVADKKAAAKAEKVAKKEDRIIKEHQKKEQKKLDKIAEKEAKKNAKLEKKASKKAKKSKAPVEETANVE
ncbi:MAG: alpha-mannosidase [Ruminococcaceae bacterium]|nr:alpha-mannosidase [Oscillospiraceae bacterium]